MLPSISINTLNATCKRMQRASKNIHMKQIRHCDIFMNTDVSYGVKICRTVYTDKHYTKKTNVLLFPSHRRINVQFTSQCSTSIVRTKDTTNRKVS